MCSQKVNIDVTVYFCTRQEDKQVLNNLLIHDIHAYLYKHYICSTNAFVKQNKCKCIFIRFVWILENYLLSKHCWYISSYSAFSVCVCGIRIMVRSAGFWRQRNFWGQAEWLFTGQRNIFTICCIMVIKTKTFMWNSQDQALYQFSILFHKKKLIIYTYHIVYIPCILIYFDFLIIVSISLSIYIVLVFIVKILYVIV